MAHSAVAIARWLVLAQALGVVIGGGNGLTKSGSGAVNLTASETYTGNTVVRNGTLNLSGNLASTNNISVGGAAGPATMGG